MRLLVLIIIISLSACSKNNSPGKILKPEKMQAVLWDYLRADAYANEILRQDTTADLNIESAKLQQKVFQQHKISKEQFYSSLDYYMEHRDKLKGILDTIIVRQQRPSVLPAKSKEDSSNLRGILNRKKLIDTIKVAE